MIARQTDAVAWSPCAIPVVFALLLGRGQGSAVEENLGSRGFVTIRERNGRRRSMR